MENLNKENGRLKLAIQKSGRMTKGSIDLLSGSGLSFSHREGVLYSPVNNFPLDILSMRDDDIPRYVQEGICDIGIVGSNIVEEERSDVEILSKLGFGRCRISICVPKSSQIKNVEDLQDLTIATSYPNILTRFLDEAKLNSKIAEISGSTEITPAIGVADAICEIISSGSTLKTHGLEEIFEIVKSEAVLIAHKSTLADKKRDDLISKLLVRIQSRVLAQGKKYVAMNANVNSIEKIKTLIPGIKSPTIIPLLEEDMVALHSVVDEQEFWNVLDELKIAGATGIVVSSIDNIIQ